MLARIPVDRRAWIPEEETYVIFSAFVYNNEKYLDLLYNEDLVGFAPKFGCFEMYVCSRQIIVAKSGKIFWKLHLKVRSRKQKRTHLSSVSVADMKKQKKKENDNEKKAAPSAQSKKKTAPRASSKKKETHSRKEYDGLSILESNLLTFIKLVNVHPDAPPFKEIVDVNVIRDYLDWVKKPMYIKLIRDKIKRHEYRTAYELMNDVKLIRDNCVHYCHSINLYLDIPPAAERIYRYAKQEMENLIKRGTFVNPEIEFVVESILEKLDGNKAALIHDKEGINIALQLMENESQVGDAVKQSSRSKNIRPKLPKATLDFNKILDIPDPSDKVEGPNPTGGGVRFMQREKIMVQTNRYGMIYGYINTFSCQIMCGTGEVFPLRRGLSQNIAL